MINAFEEARVWVAPGKQPTEPQCSGGGPCVAAQTMEEHMQQAASSHLQPSQQFSSPTRVSRPLAQGRDGDPRAPPLEMPCRAGQGDLEVRQGGGSQASKGLMAGGQKPGLCEALRKPGLSMAGNS